MPNHIDFRIRYQVGEGTPHGTLFKYLRSKETEFSLRQMVMWSLSAFWYPLACKWLGKYSDDQLQVIALNAIYELQKQISYLTRTFGLEQEVAAPVISYGLDTTGNGNSTAGPSSATTSTRGSSEHRESSIPTPRISFEPYPDDDVLDQNFN